MLLMAKKKTGKVVRSDAWIVHVRIDPALEAAVEAYQKSGKREFEPTLTQVVERALKLLLAPEGHWPPDADA